MSKVCEQHRKRQKTHQTCNNPRPIWSQVCALTLTFRCACSDHMIRYVCKQTHSLRHAVSWAANRLTLLEKSQAHLDYITWLDGNTCQSPKIQFTNSWRNIQSDQLEWTMAGNTSGPALKSSESRDLHSASHDRRSESRDLCLGCSKSLDFFKLEPVLVSVRTILGKKNFQVCHVKQELFCLQHELWGTKTESTGGGVTHQQPIREQVTPPPPRRHDQLSWTQYTLSITFGCYYANRGQPK